jgi:hypothetical protein
VVLELARKLRRLLFIAVGLVILALDLARPARSPELSADHRSPR